MTENHHKHADMPTVHMIHGFVGAGKTTFSKKLEKEIKAIRFTPDEWMCRLYGNNPPATHFDEYETSIKKVIRDTAEKVLATGADVILDYGFWKKSDRDETRKWAKDIGASTKLYALQCPDEIMKTRTLKRSAEMPEGALAIDKNALNEFRSRFEKIDPSLEECFVVMAE